MVSGYAEPGLRTNPSGGLGIWYGVLRFAFGALSMTLAVDDAWAGGDVVLADDGWRIAFGVVGAGVALLGLRGLLRALRGHRRDVNPETVRRARLYGGVVFLIGLWYEIASWSDGEVRIGLGVDSWAGAIYGVGGVALILEGLAKQIDPTPFIRKSRVVQGDGDVVTATVLRAADLGTLRGKAKVQVEMTVDLGRGVEQHSTKTLLDRSLLARIEGATVDVVVDRADPAVWSVQWDTLREAAEPSG